MVFVPVKQARSVDYDREKKGDFLSTALSLQDVFSDPAKNNIGIKFIT